MIPRLCRTLHTKPDRVMIHELAATAIVGVDAWNNRVPQPILISVLLLTDFQKASNADDLKYSLNYAVISKSISRHILANPQHNYKSLRGVGEAVCSLVLDPQNTGGGTPTGAEVTIESKKSEIRARSVVYKMSHGPEKSEILQINGLRLLTVIGVFTFERFQKQYVDLDIEIEAKGDLNVSRLINDISLYVESANFKTVEALVHRVSQLVHTKYDDLAGAVTVRVMKPNAINFTNGVGVQSTMTSSAFDALEPLELLVDTIKETEFNMPVKEHDTFHGEHTAYIAFGSNTGNQVQNIQEAFKHLEGYGYKIECTSLMYVSKPMYHKEQPDFFNGVVKVTFQDQSPSDLLSVLKKIEYEHLGRTKEFENGPRSIDLDIVLFDDIAVNTKDLVIPHKLMLERTFVLQPLCELIPYDFIHPLSTEPIHNHLKELLATQVDESRQESSDLMHYVPLPRNNKHVDLQKTTIMGILNATPDSFSDGGKYGSTEDIVNSALKMISEGALIIDIGGVSTRPGSNEPLLEEELNRVVPIVKSIRQADANVIISIDTYRSEVAEAALLAGADIINDISMGLYDDRLFEVVAKFGCPYIMSHIRGTPQTMTKLIDYGDHDNEEFTEFFIDSRTGIQNVKDPLIGTILRELTAQIQKAFKAGVRKWQVIVDPGIGFAKSASQNLHIIRNAKLLKQYTYQDDHSYLSFTFPTLVGTSRKKFLGDLTNEPVAANRLIGSVATVVAAVQQDVDIVRVHDVKETSQAVVVSDAIYGQ